MGRNLHLHSLTRWLLLFVVLAGIQVGSPALASAPTDLFISEYIEGSSNNKAIEIYNGTGAPIDLAAGGYSVQMFFNGSASAGLTINLIGTVAPGDVFVLAHSSANATILAQDDQTNGAGWFNGDDAVVLRRGTAVIDAIGQTGFDPGTEWGAGFTSTADNTLRRKASICAGDSNGADTFDPSTQWDGFATDTFDGLGVHAAICPATDEPPVVVSSQPPNGGANVAQDTTITVNFSEAVDVNAGGITLECPDGAPIAFSGLPVSNVSSVTLTPAMPLPEATNCTVTVLASAVTDRDATPDSMAADYTFSFMTVVPIAVVPIHTIQGNGAGSPMANTIVRVEGVVTGDYQEQTELRGFFMQEQTGEMDADPATSEGIFVFTATVAETGFHVSEGDLVTVTGRVVEFNNLTELTDVSNVTVHSSGNLGLVTPATGDLPIPASFPTVDAFWEQFESMLVSFIDPMTVTEYFELARYGRVQLVQGERPYQFTQINSPDATAYAAYEAEVDRRTIYLDDFNNNQNRTDVIYHPQPGGFSPTNYFRGGDTVPQLRGIVNYWFSEWRIEPQKTVPVPFSVANPRPAAPEIGGDVTVAAFNVLNYFNGPTFPTSRGADSPAEFATQREKIISALVALDADVVGVMEIENDGGSGQALEDLVIGLNAAQSDSSQYYTFVDTGVVGTDEIKVGLIYRPAVVTPVGSFAILDSAVDPDFDTDRNRPAVTQTFADNAGARFTVVVNHLKSKGSGCGSGDDDLVQGNCNGTRTRAAQALARWLATDPTGSGDPDFLIIGDLNAYAMEDPITALQNAGYVNLLGTDVYTYVFDGHIGTLDHALATASLQSQVTGAAIWHVNADEVPVLDYNDTIRDSDEATFEAKPYPLTADGPYRSSDHDPIVISLNLALPDLALTKDDGGVSTPQGERLIYTLAYSNVGGAEARDVVLTETVPAYTFFDPARSTAGWTCSPNEDAGATCTLALGTLAPGASGSAEFAVKVIDRVPREIEALENMASIALGSGSPDADLNNNAATDTTPISRRGRGIGSGPTDRQRLVEAESDGVVRTPGWAAMNRPRGASANSYIINTSSEDILVLPFSGGRVDVYYVQGPAFGTFTVIVDGQVVQEINSHSPEFIFGALVSVEGLTEGPHELRIQPTAGQVVAVDAFNVVEGAASTLAVEATAEPQAAETTPEPQVIEVTAEPLPTEVIITELPQVAEALPTASPTPLQPLSLPVIATMDDGAPDWLVVSGWTLTPEATMAGTGLGWQVSATAPATDVLVWLSPLDLRVAQRPLLSFQSRLMTANGSSAALQVQGTSGNWDTAPILTSVTDWDTMVVDLSAYRGQVISLRFVWLALPPVVDQSADSWQVDNVWIEDVPPTPVVETPIPAEAAPSPGEAAAPVLEETVTVEPTIVEEPTATEPQPPTDLPTAEPTATETPPTDVPVEVTAESVAPETTEQLGDQ